MRQLSFFTACFIASLHGSPAFAENVDIPAAQQSVISQIERYAVAIPKSENVACTGACRAEFADGFPLAPGSGLALKARQADGSISFWAVTDRGPNGDFPDVVVNGAKRPAKVFPEPGFAPRYGEIVLAPGKGARFVSSAPLTFKEGPASGLPVPPGKVGATGEVALNDQLHVLPYSDHGLDTEGVVQDASGKLWLVDEYGPFLIKADSATGTIEQKLAPGAGLPEIVATRQPNRGFEGVALSPNGKVYAAVQSTLAVTKGAEKNARFTRIVEYDPATGKTRMLAYPLDDGRYKNSGAAKIGDMVAMDNERFLIIEQGTQADKTLHNTLYLINIAGASDLTGQKTSDGRELEEAKAEELGAVQFIRKQPLVNLRDLGWKHEKAEGLALIDDSSIALINDNDFGLAASLEEGVTNKDLELAEKQPKAKLKLGASGEATELWMIKFHKPLLEMSAN